MQCEEKYSNQCRISGGLRLGQGQSREGKGRYCCDGGGKRRDLTQIVWRLDGCDRGELAGLSLVRLDCNNDLVQVRQGWTIISRNVNLV